MKSMLLITSFALTAALAGWLKTDILPLAAPGCLPPQSPETPAVSAPAMAVLPEKAPAPPKASAPPPAPAVVAPPFRASFAPAVNRVAPAVVSIRILPAVIHASDRPADKGTEARPARKKQDSKDWNDDEVRSSRQFRRQSDDSPSDGATGQGSGFIFRADGYILTNHHVIKDAGRIEVMLTDSRQTYVGEVVGSDPQTDVAVIRVKADTLPCAPLGDSSRVLAGDWVLAIGSPFGLNRTVTAGIVSATGRSDLAITDFASFIQTDASINPGNSGGPLVDAEDGSVIGISTAIFSRTGGNVGIGFAIPIRQALSLAEQIIEHGQVSRGGLGIVMETVDADMALALGLPAAEGALVQEVKPGSPAQKAGLEPGDVISALDGQKIRTHRDLRSTVASIAPGRQVRIIIHRNGKTSELKATLGDLSAFDPSIKPGASRPVSTEKQSDRPAIDEDKLLFQGMTLEESKESSPAWLGGKTGLVVTEVEPGSLAARKGVKEGCWLTAVAGQRLRGLDEARRLLEKHAGSVPVLLTLHSETHGHTLVAMQAKAAD